MRHVPLLIAGGGPAGSAAAIRLGQAGIAAELVERSAGPHEVVCGGFLGWDALAALRRLGVDAEALGARPITRLRLVTNGRIAEKPLPKAAAGLSRRALDEALLQAAGEAGATVRRGLTVRAGTDGLLRVGDEDVQAESLILATGKYDVKGFGRDVPARFGEGAVGLRTAFAPPPDVAAQLAGVIELHPFDQGYAGLLMQEDGHVNLCFSVAAAQLREAGGIAPLLDRIAAQAPAFAARLEAAGTPSWISVSNVPYGWRAAAAEGPYRVGDQASVIASLAGDGIAIALASGMAAADALIAGERASAFQKRWSIRARRPLQVAEMLRHAAVAPVRRRMLAGLARVPGAAALAARLTRIG